MRITRVGFWWDSSKTDKNDLILESRTRSTPESRTVGE